jgi:hypothetical protein
MLGLAFGPWKPLDHRLPTLRQAPPTLQITETFEPRLLRDAPAVEITWDYMPYPPLGIVLKHRQLPCFFLHGTASEGKKETQTSKRCGSEGPCRNPGTRPFICHVFVFLMAEHSAILGVDKLFILQVNTSVS